MCHSTTQYDDKNIKNVPRNVRHYYLAVDQAGTQIWLLSAWQKKGVETSDRFTDVCIEESFKSDKQHKQI